MSRWSVHFDQGQEIVGQVGFCEGHPGAFLEPLS